ncbi:MAG: hypothetical protein IPK22_22255 [Verrucomicrobiaceae bacterium]|nr:hypothetical protein [Verrucomicrobiaceae bacterium]
MKTPSPKRLAQLGFRKLLRHPASVLTAYLALLGAVCWLGSRTLWKQYDLMQAPSLLMGFCSSVGAALLGLSIARMAQWTSLGRFDWAGWRIRAFRHGLPTLAFLFGGVLALTAAFVAGPAPDLLDKLFARLETSRDGLEVVRDEVKRLRQQPRYASHDEVNFVEKVVDYWQASGKLSHEESLRHGNSFLVSVEHPQPRVKSWALLMAGDAFDRGGRKPDAVVHYTQLMQLPGVRPFLRRWAGTELGNFSYQSLNDVDAAISYWKKALEIKPTSGLLDNLALAFADNGDWIAAEENFKQAEGLLLQEANDPTKPKRPQRLASLYSNWANCIRRRMLKEGVSSKASPEYQRSLAIAQKAQTGMECYLDAYWTECRLALAVHDWETARQAIKKSGKILKSPGGCDLTRFDYDEIGPAMNLWLECLIAFSDPAVKKATPELLNRLQEALNGFEAQPFATLHNFLLLVQANDVSIDEDVKVLMEMADQRFFAP